MGPSVPRVPQKLEIYWARILVGILHRGLRLVPPSYCAARALGVLEMEHTPPTSAVLAKHTSTASKC